MCLENIINFYIVAGGSSEPDVHNNSMIEIVTDLRQLSSHNEFIRVQSTCFYIYIYIGPVCFQEAEAASGFCFF